MPRQSLSSFTRCALQLYPRLASRAKALCALESFDDAVALLGASRRHMTNSLSAFEVMWAPYFDYLKAALDPLDILNSGRVLEVGDARAP
ncbi:MAG: hypothetical protein HKN84_04855 [Gammaproteobacteria bacterium]|nr:hypothetical protein [Gammaproteobacteria bacterium]